MFVIARRGRRAPKSAHKKRPRQYKVACCVCGTEYLVPVAPPTDKQLTCLNCMQTGTGDAKGSELGP